MARTEFGPNPPETVAWAEYQQMVWQRDDSRDAVLQAEGKLELANEHCEQLEQEIKDLREGVRKALQQACQDAEQDLEEAAQQASDNLQNAVIRALEQS